MENEFQVVLVSGKGGPEVLHLTKKSLKKLSSNKLLIKTRASGIAFGDKMRRLGVLAPPWKFTPGYDLVGEVIEVGSSVDKSWIGKRVATIMPMVGLGGYSEYCFAAPEHCFELPDEILDEQALAVGLNYISAYQMMNHVAGVRAGDKIFIQGLSGNVGLAFLELAKISNVEVVGTCSKQKFDQVKNRGGKPYDYRDPNWVSQVKKDYPEGFDFVFDGVGKETLNQSCSLLGKKGRLVFFGLTQDAAKGLISSIGTFLKYAALVVTGTRSFSYAFGATLGCGVQTCVRDWKHLVDLLREKKLDPIIYKTYPFEQVRQAHRDMDSGNTLGKLVLIHRA